MQFKADSEAEYLSTINAIIDADIYDKNSMIYALNIADNVVTKIPDAYPCIISLEFEEFETDNRRYAFQACKFIYIDKLLSGSEYMDKLKELDSLDTKLVQLEAECDTSGIGFPIDEITQIQHTVFGIEKELF